MGFRCRKTVRGTKMRKYTKFILNYTNIIMLNKVNKLIANDKTESTVGKNTAPYPEQSHECDAGYI